MELVLSFALLAVAAAGLFSLGRKVARRFPQFGELFCAVSLLLGSYLCWAAGGKLGWAVWAPSNAVFQLSYAPALSIFCAAGALSVDNLVRLQNRAWLSSALCVAVVALFAGVHLRPYLRPIDLNRASSRDGETFLQSHESSCVPAAASNLLRLHGLKFSESQLAGFALTSFDGTPPLGTFLALSKAVYGTPLRAIAQVNCGREVSRQNLPILAHVRFEEAQGDNPEVIGIYSQFLQGIRARSLGHAVVIVERCNGGWVIDDPAAGRVIWSDDYLTECWKGEGVYLASK